MRKALLGIALLIASAVALLMFTGQVDDEEAIRRVIEDVAAASEDGDLGGVLEHVGEDYRDSSGLDRSGVQMMLGREFLRGRRLAVVVGPIDVTVDDPSTGRASFEAWLAEDAEGTLWPERAKSIHFDVDLKKRDGDWLVVSSEHESLF